MSRTSSAILILLATFMLAGLWTNMSTPAVAEETLSAILPLEHTMNIPVEDAVRNPIEDAISNLHEDATAYFVEDAKDAAVEDAAGDPAYQREESAIPEPLFIVAAYYTSIAKGNTTGNYNYAYNLFSARQKALQGYADFTRNLVAANAVELEYIELATQNAQTATVLIDLRAAESTTTPETPTGFTVVHYLVKEEGEWRLDHVATSSTTIESSAETASLPSTTRSIAPASAVAVEGAVDTSTSTVTTIVEGAGSASAFTRARVDPVRARRNLRLREGPGTHCRKIASLPPNRALKVLNGPYVAQNYPWYQVEDQVTGLVGWVRGDYLQFDQ